MKFKLMTLVLVGPALLSGCAKFPVMPYSLSANNVANVRDMARDSNGKVSVGEFTSFEPGLNHLTCRMTGRVVVPGGKSFETYVREALISELKIADGYDKEALAVITAHLNKVDFRSMSGKWLIDMDVTFPGHEPVNVKTEYEFMAGAHGLIACTNVANAFVPAVQLHLGAITGHSAFKEMFSPR